MRYILKTTLLVLIVLCVVGIAKSVMDEHYLNLFLFVSALYINLYSLIVIAKMETK